MAKQDEQREADKINTKNKRKQLSADQRCQAREDNQKRKKKSRDSMSEEKKQ
jgi:hypothetical protein